MNDKSLFLSLFFKSPKEIGSVTPSSKILVGQMIKHIDFRNARNIVEYGPGTGCITIELLKKARKDAKVICFETNKDLCYYLRKKIKDKRLIIVNDSAENIEKHLKRRKTSRIDYIIATLSFSTLGKGKKNEIMKETKKALDSKGKFVFCRYVPHFELNLERYFPKSSMSFVPWNLPPSMVYVCEK